MKWWLRDALTRDNGMRIFLELLLLSVDFARAMVRRVKAAVVKLIGGRSLSRREDGWHASA